MRVERVSWLLVLAVAACSGGEDAEGEAEGEAEAEGEEGAAEESLLDIKPLRERYTIRFGGKHVDGELCVNGACIASWENGGSERTMVLDGWLLPGKNAITVALAETESRPPPRSFSARVERERWFGETTRGVLEPVLDFDWPTGAVFDRLEERRMRREHLRPMGLEDGMVRALEDGTYPSMEMLQSRGISDPEKLIGELEGVVESYRTSVREKTVQYDLPHAYQLAFEIEVDVGTELWDSAEVVELSDEDREELITMAKELHEAVAARRLKEVVGMLSYAVVDTGRAQEQPEDHSTRALEFRLKRLFGKKRGFKVSKFNGKKLVFESVASRKLIALSNPDGTPPITVKTRQGPAAFQPYFARIDGRWLIARTNDI